MAALLQEQSRSKVQATLLAVRGLLESSRMTTRNYAPRRKASKGSGVLQDRMEEFYSNVANTVSHVASTLASHQSRLDSNDTVTATIQGDLRDIRRQQASDTLNTNARIDGVQRDLSDRIDGVQRDLTIRLETQTQALTEHFDKGIAEVSTVRKTDAKRISVLEKWRWVIVGAAAIVVFVVGDVLVRVFAGPVTDFVLKYYNIAKP